jgi:multiple sugar transport system permease protein
MSGRTQSKPIMGQRCRHPSLRLSNGQFGFLLTAPLLTVLAGIVLYPLAYAFWTSFQSFRLSRPDRMSFTGWDNYLWVLRDDQFHLALRNSFIYTGVAVPLELVIGLVISLALMSITIGRGLARTLIVIPMMLAPVAMGLMWKFLYNDQLGLINHTIRSLGLSDTGIPWLTDPSLALFSVIAVEIWATTPIMVILLAAGLSTIPQELYEAGRIDGASGVQNFRYVTLPLLQPIILVALLLRGMDAFRVFDLIYILTQGGPANRTDVLSYYLYRLNFVNLNVGRASAGAFLMLLLLTIMALVLMKFLKQETQ